MPFDIDDALRYLVEHEGSDLHIKVAAPPIARVHGELCPLEGADPLRPEDTEAALQQILTDPRLREEFERDGEVDFAYALPGLQRLVKRSGGIGRVAVCEVLVVTGRVQDLILNPNETGELSEVIAEGEYYGMQTFDQALLKHVQAGNIDEQVAYETASSPHDFKLMLGAGGQRASGIEQVLASENGVPPGEPARHFSS